MPAAELARFEGTVFLDRDGTINRKAPTGDYVETVSEFVLLPTVVEAVRALNEAGHRVVVVTNQRGIALGRMSEHDVRDIHEHMLGRLNAGGATVHAIYFCPHDHGRCDCRKPGVGMFLSAARDHPGLRLDQCAIFGDSECDMAAGAALGMQRVLVGGEGPDRRDDRVPVPCHYRASTLLEGVRWFLGSGATSLAQDPAIAVA